MILRGFAIGLTNTLQATTYPQTHRQSKHDKQRKYRAKQNLEIKHQKSKATFEMVAGIKLQKIRRTKNGA